MSQPRPGVCKTAQIIRIEDADTIEVEIKLKFSIRLIGPGVKGHYLDCAEKNTELGQEAIQRVKEILCVKYANDEIARQCGDPEFKEVIIFIPEGNPHELMDANSWSRLNGEVWVDGKRLGDILLDEGIAVLKKK